MADQDPINPNPEGAVEGQDVPQAATIAMAIAIAAIAAYSRNSVRSIRA